MIKAIIIELHGNTSYIFDKESSTNNLKIFCIIYYLLFSILEEREFGSSVPKYRFPIPIFCCGLMS